MLVNKILRDKFDEKNTRPIPLSNQPQHITCIITLDDFYISK